MTGRLLVVINDAGFFLSHRLPVAIAARNAGLDVQVAAPPGAGFGRVRDRGFPVHELPLNRRGMNPIFEAASVLVLAQLYRRVKPALVHHVTIKPVLYGSAAARLAGVPAVVNAVTGLGWVFIDPGWRAAVLRRGVRSAYRLALAGRRTRVVFQNPDDRDLFVSSGLVAPERAILIRGAGVDVGVFRPAPEPPGEPVVVLAGRLLRDKGVGEFVAAARGLRGRGVRARFVLVGEADDGNPAGIAPAQLDEWRREGIVELWGRRTDMPEILATSHVACLPSYREGVPKFLLEAAACGRAIVATDVPGCREIARADENALLVPPRDSLALEKALETLIGNPTTRARMGARSREIAVAEFSEERVVAETLAVYGDLLAGAAA